MNGPYGQCGHTLQVILRPLIGNLYALKGHSTITWTKFYPILTPFPPWVDILHAIYPLLCDPRGLSTDSLPLIQVHIIIEWPLIWTLVRDMILVGLGLEGDSGTY